MDHDRRSPPDHSSATVWVGDRWGPEEAEQGRHFVGPSGLFLRATQDGLFGLIPVLTDSTVYLTNVLPRYEPATPPASDYTAATPALLAALREVTTRHRRTLVVCLGLQAASAVGGHDSLRSAFNHQFQPVLDKQATAVYTWNPAHIIREPRLTRPVRDHMALVGRWLRGDHHVPSRPRLVPLKEIARDR